MKKIIISLIALSPIVLNAQERMSALTLNNGTTIKGIIKNIDPTEGVRILIAGVETVIKMDSINNIEELSVSSDKEKEIKSPNNRNKKYDISSVDESLINYKGFLLAKGNNVYVGHSNSDGNDLAKYDSEGANVLIGLLQSDGFWNVVDDINQAHFVINYIVDTRKSDKALLTISSPRLGVSTLLAKRGTSESLDENNKAAIKLYKKVIIPLQKKIEVGSVAKDIMDNYMIR